MNSAELKNYLIEQLMRVEDERFLQALKVIMDSSIHTQNNDQTIMPQASADDTDTPLFQESPEEKTEKEIEAWLKDID